MKNGKIHGSAVIGSRIEGEDAGRKRTAGILKIINMEIKKERKRKRE